MSKIKPVKTISLFVSFAPATKTTHGFTADLGVMAASFATKHEVSGPNFADLERQIRALARQFGQSCSPYIRLMDRKARKPHGFDKWANSRALQFIEYAPEVVDACHTTDNNTETGQMATKTIVYGIWAEIPLAVVGSHDYATRGWLSRNRRIAIFPTLAEAEVAASEENAKGHAPLFYRAKAREVPRSAKPPTH